MVKKIKRHFIYKTTNTKNNKYYIGRHSTYNIDDGYLGSGIGILNAIEKYGKENFKREILLETFTSEDLWEFEKIFITDEMINDPMCYNMTYGGKNHLNEMKVKNPEKYKKHQQNAGKSGAKIFYNSLSEEKKIKWHKAGAYAAHNTNLQNKVHPFYNGEAAVMGGKAIKGYMELWNPNSIATNKNQTCYKVGDCKRVKKDSDLYNKLISENWLTINNHKQQLKVRSCRAW